MRLPEKGSAGNGRKRLRRNEEMVYKKKWEK